MSVASMSLQTETIEEDVEDAGPQLITKLEVCLYMNVKLHKIYVSYKISG